MTAAAAAPPLADIERDLLARWPQGRQAPSLARIRAAMELLGEPQRTYRGIHVTGTNGKTSTARMIEAILAELGMRTGRFTSPHLVELRERICLDGRPISAQGFAQAYVDVLAAVREVEAACSEPMAFFETTVAMAYRAFASAGIDVAAVEVGMGGRWDATNVLDAEVATILPVALDHADHLGPTVLDIAAEKAGIIKPGAIAVSARQQPDVERLLREHARSQLARLLIEDRDFALARRHPVTAGQVISVSGLASAYPDLPLSLHGVHQAHNAAVAIASVEALVQDAIPRAALHRALSRITAPGRLEVLAGTPSVVLDAAHNPHGAAALVEALAELGSGPTVAVVAVMADKEYDAVLAALAPAVDRIVCTSNGAPRCLPAGHLAACARGVLAADRVLEVAGLEEALAEAGRLAEELDRGRARAGTEPTAAARVVVTGSVATVGQARRLLGL